MKLELKPPPLPPHTHPDPEPNADVIIHRSKTDILPCEQLLSLKLLLSAA